jgi:hypothetical protein
MTRSRKILAVLGMLLVLALAGCVRFQADLKLNPDDTVNGSIIVAVVSEDDDASREEASAGATRIAEALLPGLRGADGVTASAYDQDQYVGTKFDMSNTPIDAFSGGGSEGALTLTREGSEFAFTGTLDFTPDDGETQIDPDDDTSNITVAVTFPGEVSEHNGELSGTTVTWSGTLESKIDMQARGAAVSSGPPAWAWIAAAAATLLIVVAIVIVVVRSRRTAASSPPATPAG